MSAALSDFHRELYAYLVRHIDDTPRENRGQFVMNSEWHQDVRHLALELGEMPDWRTIASLGETLFGYPVVVREDGGVPHLEPCVTTAADRAYSGAAQPCPETDPR